jgi:hypothetical protein
MLCVPFEDLFLRVFYMEIYVKGWSGLRLLAFRMGHLLWEPNYLRIAAQPNYIYVYMAAQMPNSFCS